jgi:hypothetical protein
MNKQVAINQTIWDVALQHTGSIESVFEIMESNNLTSFEIAENSVLNIPNIKVPKLVEYFNVNTIVIASKTQSNHTSFNNSFNFSFN